MSESVPQSLKSMTLAELEAELSLLDQPQYRARQLLNWIYEKRAADFAGMTNLPATLRGMLASRFVLDELELVRCIGSRDTTRKFLFRLRDGNLVESVLIPASPALYGERSDRRTLCVSSQVGCAYGCKFCASGLDGLKRNLNPAEIVDQFLKIEALSREKVNNVVFMGMGEPMANFKNLLRAIEIINAPWGIGIGARHITISTSGIVPKIRALADQPLQVRLAVSLHGATDEVRNAIMPVNRRYNVSELLDACAYYAGKKKQCITFEYILIDGINDSLEQARVLSNHASRLGAKVNLIPYNNVQGLDWMRPPRDQQEAFFAILERAGIPTSLRREKGHDIDAACGQLRLVTQQDDSFCRIG